MRELPYFADPGNLVEPEEGLEGDEPRSALDYVQDVYRGRRQADPWRMRAAMAALPFETPKLAVTTNISNENFSAMLDKAIARSREPPRQIERRADETVEPPTWSGPIRRGD
jgi:hypothetical protein